MYNIVDGWPEVTADEGKLLALMNHMQYCEISTRDNINMQVYINLLTTTKK